VVAHRRSAYLRPGARALAHPQLQGLRRFTLATGDAHGLYARFGFAAPAHPQTLMERHVPDIYVAASR